ncbi:MAG: hypothetical protein ACTSUE_07730 [Promethearchaeota archaeon]
MVSRSNGIYTTILLYDTDYVSNIQHVFTNGTIMYLTSTLDGQSEVNDVVCTPVSSVEIIVGPRGCDNLNPLLAFENSNCVTNDDDHNIKRELMYDLWYFSQYDDECVIGINEKGGGDEYTCMGPVYLVRDGRDHYVPDFTQDQLDLLAARAIIIEAKTGYNAMIPSIVRIDMQLPKISVSSNCEMIGSSPDFEGEFGHYPFDSYTNMITDVWMSFRREEILEQQRLLMRRVGTYSDTFRLEFATQDGVGILDDYFTTHYKSSEILNQISQESELNDCIFLLRDGSFFTFVNSGCKLLFENDACVQGLPEPQESCIDHIVFIEPLDYWLNGCQDILFNTGEYDDTLFDCVVDTGASQDSPFNSWIDVIEFDRPYEMYDPSGTEPNCTMTMTLVEAPIPPVINPPFVVTDRNYFRRSVSRLYNTVEACSFRHGSLDSNNRLSIPYCPDRHLCGGDAVFKTIGIPGIPLFVPPDDRYLDYRDDCILAYPFDAEFLGYGTDGSDGTVTFPRMDAGRQICYAPLLIPELINDGGGFEEREKQCYMQGMVLAGREGAACWRPISQARCKQDDMWFDEFCYIPLDVTLLSRLKSTHTDADAACASLYPDLGDNVEALKGATEYISAFLQTRFVFVNRQNTDDTQHFYRVPVEGRKCFCYSYDINDPDDPTDDTPFVKTCNCEESHFPVCRYHWKHYEPIDSWKSLSVETIRVLRDGQEGVKHRGEDAICRCFNGWTGKDCSIPTCGFPIVESPDLVESANDPGSIFWTKCYANKRGMCKDGNVRQCDCVEFFGPDASLLPSPFGLDDFVDYPCACPASNRPGGGRFQINNVTFTTEWTKYLPCGGFDRGVCEVDDTTNDGRCICQTRVDLNPDALVTEEPALDGASCECRIPFIPPDGYNVGIDIVENFCNHRGICGPHGEDGREQKIDGVDVSYIRRNQIYEDNGVAKNGCVCDTGFTGEACTCVAPIDIAAQLLVQTQPFLAFVDLLTPVRVERVYVKTKLSHLFAATRECTVTTVGLANAIDVDPTVFCPYKNIEGDQFYECPTDTFARFVHVNTNPFDIHPACDIEVYSSYFPPCGERSHTNPTAGAYTANEHYRGLGQYQEPQSMAYAPFGCINSACMCNANYAGVQCNSAVSSIVMDLDGAFSKRVCGETTLPQRGSPKFSNNGTCICNTITTDDSTGLTGLVKGRFVGEACECALLYVKERNDNRICAGHGRCETPSFPEGRCLFDVLDFENDPLSDPFVRDLGNGLEDFVYVVQNRDFIQGQDIRSVFTLNGSSWFMSQGQQIEMFRMFDSVNSCNVSVKTPINITYDGTDPLERNLPIRARANLEIWTLQPCGGGPLPGVPGCTETVVTYETCDPSSVLQEGGGDCSTYTYCPSNWTTAGEISSYFFYDTLYPEFASLYTCIASQTWEEYPVNSTESFEVLEPGLYPFSWVQCGVANRQNPPLPPGDATRYGILNCNDVIHRNIDKALLIEFPDSYQLVCDHSITPFSNVLGEFYGLFTTGFPGLTFQIDQNLWTNTHYELVAKLVNNKRWFKDDVNFEPVDLWTPQIANEYIVSWLSINGSQAGTAYQNGSLFTITEFFPFDLSMVSIDVIDERYYRLNYLNEFGSYATAGLDLSTVAAFEWLFDIANDGRLEYTRRDANTTYTHFKRPGVNAIIYNDGSFHIQRVNITIPAGVYAESLEVWSMDGRLCAKVIRPLVPGDKLSFECGTAFELNNDHAVREQLQVILDNILAGSGDPIALAFWSVGIFLTTGMNIRIVPTDYTLWSPDVQHLQNVSETVFATDTVIRSTRADWPGIEPQDVDYLVRSNSLTRSWIALSRDILGSYKLPYNFPLEAAYRPFEDVYHCEDIDIGDTLDKQYLYDFWATNLAGRVCSEDWTCKKWSRDQESTTCVFNDDRHRPWRNGDFDVPNGGIGDEGGCDCDSVYSRGFYDDRFFCERCQNNDYGPRTIEEWRLVVETQFRILSLYPDFVENEGFYPLYNATEEPFATIETFVFSPDPEGLSLYLSTIAECDYGAAPPYNPNVEPHSIVVEFLLLNDQSSMQRKLNAAGWCPGLEEFGNNAADPYLTISTYFEDPNSQGLVDAMNDTMYCRFPNDASTDLSAQICGGRGQIIQQSAELDSNITLYVSDQGDPLAVKCSRLKINQNDSLVVDLVTESDDVELQRFTGSDLTFNIIYGQVFRTQNGVTSTLLLENCIDEFPKPFRCFYSVENTNEVVDIQCENPSFFSKFAVDLEINNIRSYLLDHTQWTLELEIGETFD